MNAIHLEDLITEMELGSLRRIQPLNGISPSYHVVLRLAKKMMTDGDVPMNTRL